MIEIKGVNSYIIGLDRSDIGKVVNAAFRDRDGSERLFLFCDGNPKNIVDQGIMTVEEARKIAEGHGSVKYFFDEDETKYQLLGYHTVGALESIREQLDGKNNCSVLVKEIGDQLGFQILVDGSPKL